MISAVLGVLRQLSVELGQAHQAEIQFFARTLSLRPIDEVAQLRVEDAAHPAEDHLADARARLDEGHGLFMLGKQRHHIADSSFGHLHIFWIQLDTEEATAE